MGTSSRKALLAHLWTCQQLSSEPSTAVNRFIRLHTNGNFLWYELEGLGVVDKMKRRGRPGVKRGHDQDLTDARTRLHERGIIPWDWVTDETRLVYRYTAYPSIGEGLLTGIDTTFLDPWDGDDRRSCSPSHGR